MSMEAGMSHKWMVIDIDDEKISEEECYLNSMSIFDDPPPQRNEVKETKWNSLYTLKCDSPFSIDSIVNYRPNGTWK